VAFLTHSIFLLYVFVLYYLFLRAVFAEDLTTDTAMMLSKEESKLTSALFAVGSLAVGDHIFFFAESERVGVVGLLVFE
jgi:hypothetical protein